MKGEWLFWSNGHLGFKRRYILIFSWRACWLFSWGRNDCVLPRDRYSTKGGIPRNFPHWSFVNYSIEVIGVNILAQGVGIAENGYSLVFTPLKHYWLFRWRRSDLVGPRGSYGTKKGFVCNLYIKSFSTIQFKEEWLCFNKGAGMVQKSVFLRNFTQLNNCWCFNWTKRKDCDFPRGSPSPKGDSIDIFYQSFVDH